MELKIQRLVSNFILEKMKSFRKQLQNMEKKVSEQQLQNTKQKVSDQPVQFRIVQLEQNLEMRKKVACKLFQVSVINLMRVFIFPLLSATNTVE